MMTSSIKWKHFPRYRPFVQGIHRSPVNSPHKDQWRGALMFSLIYAWINGWVNNREAGDLRRHRAHCDVIVILLIVYGSLTTHHTIQYNSSANSLITYHFINVYQQIDTWWWISSLVEFRCSRLFSDKTLTRPTLLIINWTVKFDKAWNSEFLSKHKTFLSEMVLKMWSAKWRPLCSEGSVLWWLIECTLLYYKFRQGNLWIL